jgi:chemotaxis receptor (MCP) glutamine deamidase CheD
MNKLHFALHSSHSKISREASPQQYLPETLQLRLSEGCSRVSQQAAVRGGSSLIHSADVLVAQRSKVSEV